MEEGSSIRQDRSGDGEVKKKAVVVVRKTVKMSETCDFIPCADVAYSSSSEGDSAGGSRPSGSAAAAAAASLLDAASCTGSSDAAPCDDEGGMQQDTPDYIRRGVAARHRITPLELFSAPSPLAEPSHARAAAVLEASAAAPKVDEGVPTGKIMGCQSVQETLHIEQDNRDCCGQLKQEYDSLLREKGECSRLLEDLMRENELNSRECHEAQASLHELQMELMRKSMHVGSLAFAVEGQVKEKSRWCQLLKDLSEKFKVFGRKSSGATSDEEASVLMGDESSVDWVGRIDVYSLSLSSRLL